MSGNDALFRRLLARAGLPNPVAEHRFHAVRLWRFDYAWPWTGLGPQRRDVALEVEGGVWTHGRHLRGAGFLKDIEKYNAAAELGWCVVRCTPATLCAPTTLALLRRLLT